MYGLVLCKNVYMGGNSDESETGGFMMWRSVVNFCVLGDWGLRPNVETPRCKVVYCRTHILTL